MYSFRENSNINKIKNNMIIYQNSTYIHVQIPLKAFISEIAHLK